MADTHERKIYGVLVNMTAYSSSILLTVFLTVLGLLFIITSTHNCLPISCSVEKQEDGCIFKSATSWMPGECLKGSDWCTKTENMVCYVKPGYHTFNCGNAMCADEGFEMAGYAFVFAGMVGNIVLSLSGCSCLLKSQRLTDVIRAIAREESKQPAGV